MIPDNNPFRSGVYFLRHVGFMNSKANDSIRNIRTSMSIGQELRTVGQGLESLDVEDFDLQAEGNGYFALGIPRAQAGTAYAAARSGKAGVKNALQLAWQNLTRRSSSDKQLSEVGAGVLRILFTPEGLLRLEAAGLTKRKSHSAGSPDFTKLAQVLRMVGEHLDARSGQLLKVCKRGGRISFEYATAADDHVMEEWKLSKLHDLWLDIARKRQDPPVGERKPVPESEETRISPHR
jgi:hypothetical protein